MNQPEAPRRKRPTIKEVAKAANVSVSTVSYVLNGTGPVAEERRIRVLNAVRELQYSPNESARTLKSQRSSTIGVIVPDLTNQFFAMVTEGVQSAAADRNVLVVLIVPAQTERSEEEQIRLLRSQRLDGVVYLTGTGSMPASIYDLARSGPVVLVDERIPGLDLPAVVASSRKGARAVAAHVMEMGHRQIAIIGGPGSLWTAQQRLAGYREALAAAGIDPDSVPLYEGDYRQASGRALAAKALAADPRPTALICANDLMAIGALEHCRAEGLRVPDDVSLVGFDDLPIANLLTPRLTSVRQPAHQMGEKAASLLLDLLEDRELASECVDDLPTTLEVRDSVAPPLAG